MHEVFNACLLAISALLFAIGLAGLVALTKGYRHLRCARMDRTLEDQNLLMKSPLVPPLSMLAVVRDASQESREFVRRLLNVHYSSVETILVLDGLSDPDLETWKTAYRLAVSSRAFSTTLPAARIRCIYEARDANRLIVVAKDAGGNADSLNAGVNVARSPLIGLVECGSEFQTDCFLRLVQPILEDSAQTVAACGMAPGPAGTGICAGFSALECLRAWLSCCGWKGKGNPIPAIPGSSLLISREAVMEAGGFRTGLLEFFVRLQAGASSASKPPRVIFVPEPLSYRGLAKKFGELRDAVLARQRQIASAVRWPSLLSRPIICLLTLRVLRPALETATYIMTAIGAAAGWIDLYTAAFVAISTIGMGILQSMSSVVLRELAEPGLFSPGQLAGLFLTSIPENLGYRQLRNFWMMAGLAPDRRV
ncbi:MAG: hypothetical protein C5B51_28265 [Terriglobia bacterium]|nr:MAG: hypothetical protein C5B51_28265 [Terriglobia bacterium]